MNGVLFFDTPGSGCGTEAGSAFDSNRSEVKIRVRIFLDSWKGDWGEEVDDGRGEEGLTIDTVRLEGCLE